MNHVAGLKFHDLIHCVHDNAGAEEGDESTHADLSIGTVNIMLLLTVAVIAYLLGGQIGVGTLITLFGTGVVMDAVNKIVKFEPRNVVHEGITETVSEFRKALRKG